MVVTELTDAELLDRARDGDESAFTSLYVRHHGAISRLAASYRRNEPEDLVDATFGQVVSQLRRRSGPTEAFRAYLFATLHAEVVASPAPALPPPAAVPEAVALVAGLPALGGVDREMTTRAFESLPDQWQVPLWHTTIVGTDLRALASGLGVTTAAARPLARYAGRKLRQAYLQAHLDAAPRPACEPHRERLTAHLQGVLDPDADAGVRSHLERCDSCRELIAGLSGVEELLARSVVPYFPVAAGRGGVPTPMGAPGSKAIEVTGEGPVLDVPAAASAGTPGPTGETGGFSAWWRRRRSPAQGDAAGVGLGLGLGAGPAVTVTGRSARSGRLRRDDTASGSAGPAGSGRLHGDATSSDGSARSGRLDRDGTGSAGSGGSDGSGADDGSDGDGYADDGSGRWGPLTRGRRVMPALGGVAAVTVFVAGLAMVGARLIGDDSGPGIEGAAADGTGDEGEADDGRSSGSGSRDGRKGPSDRTTTTVAGDDDRPSPDDDRDRIEPVPRRGDSAASSGSALGSSGGSVSGTGSGSGSGSGSTTATTTRRSTTTTRPAGTTTTVQDPDPPTLASWSVGWSAASASSGTLRATVSSPSGSGAVDTRAVVITVDLSAGAQVGSLDSLCSGSGGQVTCTVPAPGDGEATTVSIGVTVDGPGETASVSARQGSSSLGSSRSVSLTVSEAAA